MIMNIIVLWDHEHMWFERLSEISNVSFLSKYDNHYTQQLQYVLLL